MKRLAFVPGLHRATHRVGLYLRSRVPEVSQAEAHLLTHLHECGGAATVAELHRAWAHKRSTLTDILDRLEDRGLARRSVLPQDRRSVLVALTARGVEVGARVHAEIASLEARVLAELDASVPRRFGELLAALERAAETAASEAKPAARAAKSATRRRAGESAAGPGTRGAGRRARSGR
jgi:DNA-binding MarR family transcriptional regulator